MGINGLRLRLGRIEGEHLAPASQKVGELE